MDGEVHNGNRVHPTLSEVDHPLSHNFSDDDVVGLDNSILILRSWRFPCQSDASRADGKPLYICWCARGYCMHTKTVLTKKRQKNPQKSKTKQTKTKTKTKQKQMEHVHMCKIKVIVCVYVASVYL